MTEKIKLNGGSTVDEIQQAEKFIDFLFPDEFKQLYVKVNGFFDWDMNMNMISLWPVDRIIQEYKEETDKNFIGFCDYLINCHAIGFYKVKHGIFKSYDEFNPVAMDFKDVMELINSDSTLIY